MKKNNGGEIFIEDNWHESIVSIVQGIINHIKYLRAKRYARMVFYKTMAQNKHILGGKAVCIR